MSSLFAGLKEKFADKLAEFKGAALPHDPNEKHAAELVEAATSDELIAPDMNLNLNVVDFVNTDVRLNSGRILKAIKRSLAKPNTKVQLLSLTLLEMCVKNCPAEFHVQLAVSDLWTDVVKLAEDTSITRVDAEVRDKVLGMIEDFSRFLQPPQFQGAYESLLDRGVDFPVRGTDAAVPFLTPPLSTAGPTAHPPGHATAGQPAPASVGGDAVAAAPGADAAVAGAADPLAGLDEQDRVAIQAALAELEAEAAAAREAERVAAAADAEERRQLQQQQQQLQQSAAEAQAALGLLAAAQTAEAVAAAHAGTATSTALAAPADQAAAAATTAGVAVGVPSLIYEQQHPQEHPPAQPTDPGVTGAPPALDQQRSAPAEAAEGGEAPLEHQVATLLETANNTTMLLSEMLASVPDSEPLAVREPYVAEVADTCLRMRRRLERHLVTLSDEALLSSAISQHEDLSRVLQRYDELLAAAEAVAPTVPVNAAAVALSHAAASRGAPPQPGMAPYGQLPPQLQHPAEPHGAAPQSESTGQKVAAVAAALKERFTGAIDKLFAAVEAARTPGTQTAGAGAAPAAGGSAIAAAPGGHPQVAVTMGGSGATGAAAPGAFTLLDDDDEEAHEGTSLIARRTAGTQGEAAAAQPAAVGAAPAETQLQHLMHYATAAATAAPAAAVPAAAPPPSAPAGPDLINFDDEGSPAASRAPAVAASESGLLSGLTLHSPSDGAERAAGTPPPPQPPPSLQPLPVSRGGSTGDELVEELDRLVSQSSLTASPGDAGAPHEARSEVPAAPLHPPQEQL